MTLVLDKQIVQGGAIVTRMHRRAGTVAPADTHDMREEMHRHHAIADVDGMLRQSREAFMRDIEKLLARSMQTDFRAGIPANAYIVNTGSSAISLTAATAKTVIYLNAGSNNAPSLVEFCLSFDGVTATAVPALCELCFGTAASNSTPGTGSTSFTPVQSRSGGPASSSSSTAAANNCTSEPTVLVSHRQWLVSPYGGLLMVQFPMGREPTGVVTASTTGKQQALRVNAPATVGVRGYTEHEE